MSRILGQMFAILALVLVTWSSALATAYTWDAGGTDANREWSYNVAGPLYRNWDTESGYPGKDSASSVADSFKITGPFTAEVSSASYTVSNNASSIVGGTNSMLKILAGCTLNIPSFGSTTFEIGGGTTAGRTATGMVEVAGTLWRSVYRSYVGAAAAGITNWGFLTIKTGGLLVCSNASQLNVGSSGNAAGSGSGTLRIENNATGVLAGAANSYLTLGGWQGTTADTAGRSDGLLDMRGGVFYFNPTSAGDLLLKLGSSSASTTSRGVVQGYGKLLRTGVNATTYGYAIQLFSGCMIADGGDLDLRDGQYKAITNGLENTTSNGWYATNKGSLLLPWSYSLNTGSNYVFGENVNGLVDLDPDLVNSVLWSNVMPSAVCSNRGVLLAADHANLNLTPPPASSNDVVSAWEFMTTANLTNSGTMVYRYDDFRATNTLQFSESALRLYAWTNSATGWILVNNQLAPDTVKHQIAVTNMPLAAGTNRFIVTIPAATVSVASATTCVTEGPPASTTNATFVVQLSRALSYGATVNYTTANGTATTGDNDYTATNGLLTFAPGVTSLTGMVSVIGDSTPEPDEAFTFTLSTPTNCVLGASVTTCTISNDDVAASPPCITNTSASVTGVRAVLGGEITNGSGCTVTFYWGTNNGQTVAGNWGATQTLVGTYGMGAVSNSVTGLLPSTEYFYTCFISNNLGTNWAQPSVVFTSQVAVVATNLGATVSGLSADLVGKVMAPGGAASNVFCYWGPTSAGAYTTTNTIPGGPFTLGAPFTNTVHSLLPNTEYHYTYFATNSDGTSLAVPEVVFTSAYPNVQFSVAAGSGSENATNVSVSVTLSEVTTTDVVVQYAATGGTATVLSDYTLATNSLTIAPGQLGTNFSLTVVDDTVNEPDETVILALTNATGATLGSLSSYTYTILTNDWPLVYVWDGDGGAGNEGWSHTNGAGLYDNWTNNPATVPGTYLGDSFTISGINKTSIVEAGKAYLISNTVGDCVVGGTNVVLQIAAGGSLSIIESVSKPLRIGGNTGGTATGTVEVSGTLFRAGYRTMIGDANANVTARGTLTIKTGGQLICTNLGANQSAINIGSSGGSATGSGSGTLNIETNATVIMALNGGNNGYLTLGGWGGSAAETTGSSLGVLDIRGGILQFGSGNTGNEILLKLGSSSALTSSRGVIQGYGQITKGPGSGYSVTLYTGQIMADGEGANRDLDLRDAAYASTTNGIENTTSNGCYAINQGRLLMPWSYTLNTGSNYVFGETVQGGPDFDPDLVNSVLWSNVMPAAACSNRGSLVAVDRGGLVLPVSANETLAVWEFMATAAMTNIGQMIFRYDDNRATALSLAEAALQLYLSTNAGSTWVNLDAMVNAANNQIVATGKAVPVGTNLFAVGAPQGVSITSQPVSLTNNPGTSASFTVGVSGTAPLYYQWQKNAADIALATNATYVTNNVASSDAGSYRCVVSNMVNSVTSSVATLTVNTAVSIDSQSGSLVVNEGEPANFSVTASGTAPVYYRWQKGAADISDATNASYVISRAAAGDAGDYRCIVSNLVNAATSVVATLTVNGPVAISGQPQSQTNNPGTPASFTVVPSGTPPFYYQWRTGAVEIVAATNATYAIASVTAADAGSYDCIVSNAQNAVTSQVATLTVNVPAAIALQPVSQTNNPGTSATFTVGATGTEPLYYQWQTNGVSISLATSASYTINPVTNSHAGNYRCIVSNMANAVTSDVAVLSVNTGVTITSQPVAVTTNAGCGVTLTVGTSGTEPIYYQWQYTNVGPVVVDIAAATNASYTITPVSVTNAGYYRCFVSNMVNATTSTAAKVTVNSYTWSGGGGVNTGWSYTNASGQYVNWVGNPVVLPGALDTFTIAKTGGLSVVDGDFFVANTNLAQCYIGATNGGATLEVPSGKSLTIATNATNPSLNIGNQTASEIGTLIVRGVVTNGCILALGQKENSQGTLIIDGPAAVLNQNGDLRLTFTTPNAVGANPQGTIMITNGGTLRFGTSGNVNVGNKPKTAGSSLFGMATVDLRNGSLLMDGRSLYLGDTNGCTAPGTTNGVSSIGFIRGYGKIGRVATTAPNLVMSVGAVTADGDNVNSNLDMTEISYTITCETNAPNGLTGWYATNKGRLLMPPLGSAKSYNFLGEHTSHWDPTLVNSVVWSNVSPPVIVTNALVAVDCDGLVTLPVAAHDILSLWEFKPSTAITSVGLLTFRYDHTRLGSLVENDLQLYMSTNSGSTWANLGGTVNGAKRQITLAGVAVPGGTSLFAVGAPQGVTITHQPVSLTNNPGTAASFTVGASGTGPLHYQWQKNATDIGATTNATYTTNAITAGDAGNYRCIVSNMVSSVTSSVATLTVNTGVSIDSQSGSLAVNAGDPVNFSVTASGTAPLYYRWQKGAADIGDATNASYAIGTVAAGDAADYRCIVSNVVNTATSAVATLTVNGPVAITTQPQSQTNNPGTPASFTVVPSGTPPFYYQWRTGAVEIVAATNATYTIASVTASDAGGYDCIVSNAQNAVTSQVATLTVNEAVAITIQPVSLTRNPGTSASFTVGATGTAPLHYQWQTNGVSVSLATNATYTIDPVANSHAGNYRCIVSNTVNAVTSDVAVLTVNAAVAITLQPVAVTTNAGCGVTFTVGTSGTEPIYYQWQYTNVGPVVVDIAAATNASYTIIPVSVTNAGYYRCFVSNIFNVVTSSAVKLTANNYTWSGGGGDGNAGWSYTNASGQYVNWAGNPMVLPGMDDSFTIGGVNATSIVEAGKSYVITNSGAACAVGGSNVVLQISAGSTLDVHTISSSSLLRIGGDTTSTATGTVEVSGAFIRRGYRWTIGEGKANVHAKGTVRIMPNGTLTSGTGTAIYLGTSSSQATGSGVGELYISAGATCTLAAASGSSSGYLNLGGWSHTTADTAGRGEGLLDIRGGALFFGPASSVDLPFRVGGPYALSRGTVQGYGTLGKQSGSTAGYSYALQLYNGTITADGGDLDLREARYASITNGVENTTSNGCYAIRQGRLIMPWSYALNTGSNYVFGESVAGTPDMDPDLVNSVVWSNVMPAAVCSNRGTLVSVDYSGLALAEWTNETVAAWEFTTTAAMTNIGQMIFRYSEARAAALNLRETDLRLFLHAGAGWARIPGTVIDPVKHQLIATGQSLPAGTNVLAIGKSWSRGSFFKLH